MSVIKSAVKNPVTTALIFVAFVILGLYSLVNTSIALFPEFDSNTIMVMSSYPGANASDIETEHPEQRRGPQEAQFPEQGEREHPYP